MSELDIEFPKNGFFIAVEWLFIDNNKYHIKTKGSREKTKRVSYEPYMGTVPSLTDENSWRFRNGEWVKVSRVSGISGVIDNAYYLTSVALTLTN